MKQICATIFVLFFVTFSFAQDTASISGRLVDTTNKQLLQAASINLVKANDSSKNLSTISEKDGSFKLKNIVPGNYNLFISFTGYETIQIKCTVDSSSVVLGNIYMQQKGHDLQAVVVTASPIIIKKDTVVYNAGSFSTKPDANVEDLLKKLPGVDVDQSGNIKAQGETVQRVLVNGKRFFGDDPKMATQNLPPDVVDRIEVFDDLSDQSAFTGFDDGTRVKTINIITKKNKNKGYFGKATVGAGNKGLYEGGVTANRFNDNQQITFVAQGNNTNQQLFTVQDILGTTGNNNSRGYAGGQGGGGGSRGNSASTSGGGYGGMSSTRGFVQGVNGMSGNNGITTTWAAGLNYRDDWGKKTTVAGSYFYNNLAVLQNQQSTTQNLFESDSSTFNNQVLASTSRNINQRINFNIETQFDSATSMIIRPNISYQTANLSSQTNTNITDNNFKQLSNSVADNTSYNDGYNGNIDMLLRHRFKKTGRTISLDENVTGNSNDSKGYNFSVVNDSSGADITNQYYISNAKGHGFSTTLAYTEPIKKNQLIQFTYNNSYTKNDAGRQTFNYDSASKTYISIDTALTNTYENTYISNRGTLDYLVRSNKINLDLGSGVQFGKLSSLNESKDSLLTQNFVNFYPTANLSYRISTSKNLRINYSGRTTQPTIQQLQPVLNNTDPLNIQLGNPDLKQEFTNTLRFLYTSFDRVHFRNMFASINASEISNDIVNSTTILSNGAQILKPVNLNGAYNLSGFFNYGFPINKPKMNLNFTTNLSFAQSPSLVNGEKNITRNSALGESFKLTTNLKKDFDLNLSVTPTYNIASYSLQPTENANYFSQTLSAEPTYYSSNGWIISSTFNLTSYSGRAPGYNTSVPLWNAYIAKQFLKNKSGELRFFVFDILNQNVSIVRNVTENYIQDVQTKVLTRYFLVSFIYNLRKFGAQMQPIFHRRNNDGMMPPASQNGMPPPPPPQNGGPGPGPGFSSDPNQ